MKRDWLDIRIVGVALFGIGLVTTLGGNIYQYGGFDARVLFTDMYTNVGAELISIALTVLLIDRLYERRRQREARAKLISEVGSKDNATALRAIEELGAAIREGVLVKADLKYANLADAILQGADLRGAYLTFANLHEADLRDAKLSGAILRQADLRWALLLNVDFTEAKLLEADLRDANLHGVTLRGANLAGATLEGARGLTDEVLATCDRLARATLPNGSLYDGRYNLPGDLDRIAGGPPEEAARYYGVPLEVYQRGQG